MRYTSLSRQVLHRKATIGDHLEDKFLTGGQKIHRLMRDDPLVDDHGVERLVVDLVQLRSSLTNLSDYEICVVDNV